MEGLTYFQSKGGSKRKPETLLDTAAFRRNISAGIQREALQELGIKNSLRVQKQLIRLGQLCYDWRFKLQLGFSILVYGYGSKKAVLDRLGADELTDGGVLAVNGWAHSLTIRSLLLRVIGMLRKSGLQSTSASGDARALLQSIRSSVGSNRLYIIIHAIDSPGLRGAEAQTVLSELAATKGLHVIASVDHVNAPLLWDKRTAARFNWLYQDLSSFAPYNVETVHMQPLLYSSRRQSEMQTATVVLQTLVPNARRIFRLLAENQLEGEGESGMTVHDLFKACREQLLVANELALRSHLNEFRDHQLVQTRRGHDGVDILHIPLADAIIQQILEEVD